jgi:hypothetical protein
MALIIHEIRNRMLLILKYLSWKGFLNHSYYSMIGVFNFGTNQWSPFHQWLIIFEKTNFEYILLDVWCAYTLSIQHLSLLAFFPRKLHSRFGDEIKKVMCFSSLMDNFLGFFSQMNTLLILYKHRPSSFTILDEE